MSYDERSQESIDWPKQLNKDIASDIKYVYAC